jgi:vacuolar iron transporter family protein
MGVGAGSNNLAALRLTGVVGLLAGSLSMAVGEFISVSAQREAEKADILKEEEEQRKGPEARARELRELTLIYENRGLPPPLASQVAEHLTRHDVIRAHARDELGIDIDELANPLQAAIVSGICFSGGAAMPLLSSAFIGDKTMRLMAIAVSTTIGLMAFGLLGAHLGGASLWKGILRVLVGGWLALAITFGVGQLFDV